SFDLEMPELEDISTFHFSNEDEDDEDINTFHFSNEDEDDGAEADMNNLDTTIQVSPTPTTKIHKDHPIDQIEEEVYVCQPLGFEDLDFPDKVYKVEKALYGLHQAPRACQDKHIAEILKKYGFLEVKNASTPMETQKPLLKDEDGEEVDVHMIFRYLKGHPKLGLWYLKDSPFDLVTYTDSDYAGASLDKKSTVGGSHPTDPHHIPTIISPSTSQPQKKQKSKKTKRKDTKLPLSSVPTSVVDEAVNEAMGDNLEKDTTTATSLDAECQEAMKDAVAQTKSERVSKISNDPLLARPSQVKDKGKGKMVEQEHVKKFSKKDQLMLDEELAFKLQAEEEEKRISKEKAQQIEEKRRKFFAAKRAEEKRNKPPTKSQQRSIMCTDLINMDGWKLKSLKKKTFTEIQELFDKAMQKVNTFVDFKTELVEESSKKDEAEITQEGSSKRAGIELEQERSKKPKVEDNKESKDLKKCLEIILDDGDNITIDATPLSSKSLTIVGYKIYQEGKKSYF
nr:hypothetical protein [Tanacetum cinerariifolium]